MASVFLALAAAVSWGVSDFLGGMNSRHLPVITVVLVGQVIGFLLLVPLAMLRGPLTLEPEHVAAAVAGSISGLIGIAALYRGMAVGSVSIVAPISATGAAIPVLFGLLRGDQATLAQYAGIVLVLIGVFLASRTQSGASSAAALGPGVALAFVAAVGFGGFFVLLHQASARDVIWATTIQRLTGVTVMGVMAAIWRPNLRAARSRAPTLIASGTLDTVANVLYASASQFGLVSLAAVLASLFPVVTVLLARVVLNERISRSQAGGVVSALVGVALIAFP